MPGEPVKPSPLWIQEPQRKINAHAIEFQRVNGRPETLEEILKRYPGFKEAKT